MGVHGCVDKRGGWGAGKPFSLCVTLLCTTRTACMFCMCCCWGRGDQVNHLVCVCDFVVCNTRIVCVLCVLLFKGGGQVNHLAPVCGLAVCNTRGMCGLAVCNTRGMCGGLVCRSHSCLRRSTCALASCSWDLQEGAKRAATRPCVMPCPSCAVTAARTLISR